MGWLVLGVWIGAVVLAAVVLTFCLYEVLWKGKRLRADLERLNTTAARLTELQQELNTRAVQTQRRLADANS